MISLFKPSIRMFFRILLAFMAFAIEIKVKASTSDHTTSHETRAVKPAPTQIVFSPRGCWEKTTACLVLNSDTAPFPAKMDSAWTLAPQAFVERISEDQLRHFKGTLWVKAEAPFKVRTEFGEAEIVGQALLKKTRKEWNVWALQGNVRLNLKGKNQVVELPSGFHVTVGGITSLGLNVVSIPQLIQPQNIAATWARAYPGTIAELKATLLEMKNDWSNVVEVAADWQKNYIERAVADAEDSRRRDEQRRLENQRRNQEMLDLYKEKNFLSN